jgi:hypothetical protein
MTRPATHLNHRMRARLVSDPQTRCVSCLIDIALVPLLFRDGCSGGRWCSRRAELARMPSSGRDWAAAANMIGSGPVATLLQRRLTDLDEEIADSPRCAPNCSPWPKPDNCPTHHGTWHPPRIHTPQIRTRTDLRGICRGRLQLRESVDYLLDIRDERRNRVDHYLGVLRCAKSEANAWRGRLLKLYAVCPRNQAFVTFSMSVVRKTMPSREGSPSLTTGPG